ncbi:unnamed protein product [Allacma fusca]|uniref:Protein kinase domain-containing protein n=1 Tax=Allacma fusca TaxID=39272 RepID=A0A8J2M700_9HEXA|nr:unnamed protein product [Allacma fusca]
MTTFSRDFRATEPPVLVQWPTNKVSLEDKLHDAVLCGKLQKIRDIAARGVNVDAFNEDGQTPLFCAAFKGLADVVGVLLSMGAKPNARCQPEGYTAVHGACYSGCAGVLKMLIQAGGDLRICDHKRRTPIAWSLLQTDSSKIQAIRNVVESARVCTTETSGLEMLKEMQSSLSPRTSSALGDVVRSIFRKSVIYKDSRSRLGFQLNMDELNNGIHHTGFGKVFFGNGERCAGLIGLPYVSEVSDLEDEKSDDAPSWQCGKFTSFNARVWTTRKTQVSTRELFTKSGPHCVPDILINELEVRSKLHHPNLLMLLGVCQTNHCESISLVYERVNIGSLYSVLYVEQKQLTPRFATDVIIQMCDALEYVHSMKMIHCAISSHSVILVANGLAKLSCFEYCLPENINSESTISLRHPILTSDAHLNVLRYWMAPEVLLRQQFSVKADVYSLACVMWELCNLDIPWRTFSLQSLRQLFSSSPAEPLPINKSKVPQLWYHLMSLGLKPRRESRDLDIAEIKDMMVLSKKPHIIQGSRSNLFGHQKVSAVSVTKNIEPESEDGLDDVDFASVYPGGGQIYKSTSTTSLQDQFDTKKQVFETSPVFFKGRSDCVEGLQPMNSDHIGRFSNAIEVEVGNSAGERIENKVSPPQGILKKFGVTKQSKSNIGSQSFPICTNFSDEAQAKRAKEKETQTESQQTEKQVLVTENQEVRIQPPKKPERIGAIMSLGIGWIKPASKTGANVKTCKGTQTGATKVTLQHRLASGEKTPSPVHSPASASTPLWTSFNTSKEPIDIILDPESQAARHNVKEKLNKILEMRQAGDYPRGFHSLRLPKKATFIKPASHCIEGVSSALNANANEFWNYFASTSLVTTATCDKVFAPAIKPAGHSLTLEKNGSVMGQKSRSHLDLPLASKEDMVPTGLVFETVDKFNAYAKGMPLDFQRQRVPWQPMFAQIARNDGGDGNRLSSEYSPTPSPVGETNTNPFQQQFQSVAIQCMLSPDRYDASDTSLISTSGVHHDNYHQSVNNLNEKMNDDESEFSEKVSSGAEDVALATVDSLMKNLANDPGSDPANVTYGEVDVQFVSCLMSPKDEDKEATVRSSSASIREHGDTVGFSPRVPSTSFIPHGSPACNIKSDEEDLPKLTLPEGSLVEKM